MARHKQTISCAINFPERVAVQGLDEGLTLSCQMYLISQICDRKKWPHSSNLLQGASPIAISYRRWN